MTKTEALEKHRKMWLWIANTIHNKQKPIWKSQYFAGKGEIPFSYCYCCEYARSISVRNPCSYCPVIWGGNPKHKCVEHEHKKWIKAMCKDDWKSAEKYARVIANLPERS